MSVTVSSPAVAPPEYVRRRAQDLIAERRKNRGGAQVLVLRARPEWRGEQTFVVDGVRVHVRPGISQFSVLAAYDELHDAFRDGDVLVVLTDRDDRDLGDAVLVRAWKRSGQPIDQWSVVPGLFHGARSVGRDLRRIGDWVPEALLTYLPSAGWPTSPGLELSSEFVLSNLLAHLLGRSVPETIDDQLVLDVLGDRAVRGAWANVPSGLRERLTSWACRALGPGVAVPLRIAASGRDLSPLVVALAADVLWPPSAESLVPEQAEARGRIERYTGEPLDHAQARELAGAAHAALLRLEQRQPDGQQQADAVLRQAERLLADLRWEAGAQRSDLLPAGFVALLRSLGSAIIDGDLPRAEALLVRVDRHGMARVRDRDAEVARMAVRLGRWLARAEPDTPASIGAAMRMQMDDGAWVDRALAHVWRGSRDPELGAAYGELAARVRARRRSRDIAAAERLAAPASGTLLIENVLGWVVRPWTGKKGSLLVVLDGMSAAVATELAEELRSRVQEWVPAGLRAAALAALPSLTSVSRASLLAGRVASGSAKEEMRLLAEAWPGSVVFHKDALRASSGNALKDDVARAIKDPGVPVVAAVLNRIDDTLHKTDVHDEWWTVDDLRPLGELIGAAVQEGRTVVLTSDHGHIAERGTSVRASRDSREARVRSVSAGPAGDGEVLVSGPRVRFESGEAVLAVTDDVRYGPKQYGYHGGAALAEVTVPVLVFAPPGAKAPEGWEKARPQAPLWWNERVAEAADSSRQAPRGRKAEGTVEYSLPDVGESADGLFTVTVNEAPTASGDAVAYLLRSEEYAQQREMGGRHPVADDIVEAILRALLARGGRAHRDTVAAEAKIAASEVESTIAAVKRLLNVDGYPVLSMEDAGTAVRLDEELLRDQFGIGRQ